jgi:acetolactate synthase-1/2/3 large subunit
VLVDVPMDVFSAEVDSHFFTRLDNNTADATQAFARRPNARVRSCVAWPKLGSRSSTRAAASWERRRGKGCKRSSTHSAFLLAHSLMGKGALPDDHPLLLGMSGSGARSW